MENNQYNLMLQCAVEETNILPLDEIGPSVNTFMLGATKNFAYDNNGNLKEVTWNNGVDYSSFFEMEERANTLFNHPDNDRAINPYEEVFMPQRYKSQIKDLTREHRQQAREAKIQNRYNFSQREEKPNKERISYINKPNNSSKLGYLNLPKDSNNQNEIVMKPKKKEKNYEEIANVFYPDMPEVSQIKARAKKEMYEIEKERWLEHAKNFAGAGLEIGSALIPLGAGARLGYGIGEALIPVLGKKIAQEVGTGLASGAVSGAVGGLGRGMLEDENPLKTMATDGVIGGATGGLGGYALGQLAKGLARKSALNNADEVSQYVDDYLTGVTTSSKADLSDLRSFRVGGGLDVGKNENILNLNPQNIKIKNKSNLYDKLNDNEEFDVEKAFQLAEDLKSGKRNPLKNDVKSAKIEDITGISSYDMEYLRHELNNNLTPRERKRKIIQRPVGDYIFKIKNNGFDDYEYIERELIDGIINN